MALIASESEEVVVVTSSPALCASERRCPHTMGEPPRHTGSYYPVTVVFRNPVRTILPMELPLSIAA